eukprot:TRINITY_DN7774_c0_g1_i2.p1 TRINITY_DN7774_c0_g1~~TRINITY_DN7774_c0_g1_i2.p1  ORF type:complete len:347 (+),score=59.20 TRINITY_DN7774_c0_g1_i2:166-1206(+)
MCRWLVYIGTDPVVAADIILKPIHSIVSQCYEHYLPDIVTNWNLSTLENLRRVNHTINGDGYGVGWYVPHIEPTPCVFVSTTPPWNNRNLMRLCRKIESTCIFCHVRAASPGSFISEANCHPFNFGRYLFMHNGGIPAFIKYKVKILQALSEKTTAMIAGTTDTEHIGAYFVEQLGRDPNEESTVEEIRDALLKTIGFITKLTKKIHRGTLDYEVELSSSLNLAVTDGKCVVATRYRNHPTDQPPSLYYSIARKVTESSGILTLHHPKNNASSPSSSPSSPSTSSSDRICIIASEPLTYTASDWTLIPKNHYLMVDEKLNVTVAPIYVGTIVEKSFKRWRSYKRTR